MTDCLNIITFLGLPEKLGIGFVAFCFILFLSPYFSGKDFGIFKVPDFSISTRKTLKYSGPIIFFSSLFIFIPLPFFENLPDVDITLPEKNYLVEEVVDTYRGKHRVMVNKAEQINYLRYNYQRIGQKILIEPDMPYFKMIADNEIVPGLVKKNEPPFEWSYPEIIVNIVNDTSKKINVSELVYEVKSSDVDMMPLLTIDNKLENGVLNIYNEGWADIINNRLKIDFIKGDCMIDNLTSTTPEDLLIRNFDDVFSLPIIQLLDENDVKKVVSCPEDIDINWFSVKDMRKKGCAVIEPLCVIGELTYDTINTVDNSFKFFTKLYLWEEVYPQAPKDRPFPRIKTYAPFLIAGKSNYAVRLPNSIEVESGKTGSFKVLFMADKSAKFNIKLSLFGTKSRLLYSQDIDLNIFVPQSRKRTMIIEKADYIYSNF